MAKKDWKTLVGAIAPGLATALGGPLAGVAVQTLSNSLLGNKDGTEQDVATAVLTGGGDALLKIKQAEADFQIKLKELDIKLEEINAADRGSARQLAVHNMWPQITISIVFFLGYFGSLFAVHGLLFVEPGQEINGPVLAIGSTLVGVFTRELSGIMAFWFGSSSGSKDKTAHIAKSKKDED